MSSSSSCHTRIQRVFSSGFPQPNIGESGSREEGWGRERKGLFCQSSLSRTRKTNFQSNSERRKRGGGGWGGKTTSVSCIINVANARSGRKPGFERRSEYSIPYALGMDLYARTHRDFLLLLCLFSLSRRVVRTSIRRGRTDGRLVVASSESRAATPP